MWIVGAVWLAFGIVCFCRLDKKYRSVRRKGILLGVFFTFFGVVGLAGFFLENEIMEFTSTFFTTAVMCIGTLVNIKIEIRCCDMPVWATYISCNTYYGGKGRYAYAPVFRYTFNGMQYECQSPKSFSSKRLSRRFQAGQYYQIFIDQANPERCVEDKKVPVSYYFSALLGVFLLVFYIARVCESMKLW